MAAVRPTLGRQRVPPHGQRHPGIHAIEIYVPRHCVQAQALEAEHGVPGKYTEGLMMEQWGACDEDEDVVSMARTAVRRLVEKQGLAWEDIGFLNVGTESLLDRSKSIKSHLMALFPKDVVDVEGVDYYHACYGGTASLFACTNWVGSSQYDGRWAICVCTDVADAPVNYPFMNGAACVAMLVGSDAPLHLEGKRHTHMLHEWDFYKPVGWPTMGPIIDGPGSMEVYYTCLRACQAGLQEKGEGCFVDCHDHLVFHLGASPKFVRHAFEQALAHARGVAVEELSEADVRARFARLVAPSLRLAARIGPCHTAATYVNLASLLLHDAPKLGASIGVFSYGSGAASTMFRLRVRGNCRVGRGLVEGLDAREVHSGAAFSQLTKRFADTYGRFDWTPHVRGAPALGAYRLERCDALGRRTYEYIDAPTPERYTEEQLQAYRDELAARKKRDAEAAAAAAARKQAEAAQQAALQQAAGQGTAGSDPNALVQALMALMQAQQQQQQQQAA